MSRLQEFAQRRRGPLQSGGHRWHEGAQTRWPLFIALVGLLIVVAVVLSSRPDASAQSRPPGDHTAQPGAAGSPAIRPPRNADDANVASAAQSQVEAQRPSTLALPSGMTVAVESTATAASGELTIPADINHAGWWDGSSRVGDPFGTIVVAAHVDSFSQGLGRFAELLDMHRGDVVTVQTADFSQRFRVISASLVPKASVTASSPLFSTVGPARLVMMTCGGAYDPATGYHDNMVVVAVPQGPLQG